MEKFKQYTGTEQVSIVRALTEMGEDSAYETRKIIAEANGITNYSGTAEQNLNMLALLKQGELIRPSGDTATADTAPTETKTNKLIKYGTIGLGVATAFYLGYKLLNKSDDETAQAHKPQRKALKGLSGTDRRTISLKQFKSSTLEQGLWQNRLIDNESLIDYYLDEMSDAQKKRALIRYYGECLSEVEREEAIETCNSLEYRH